MNLGELENNLESLNKLDKHIVEIENDLKTRKIKNMSFIVLGVTSLLGALGGVVQGTINYNQFLNYQNIAANITEPALLAAFSFIVCVYSFNKIFNGISEENQLFSEHKQSANKKNDILKGIEKNEILVSTQGPNGNVYKLNHNDIRNHRDNIRHKTSKGAIMVTKRSF